MTKKELIKKLERVLAKEKKEIIGYMKGRRDNPLTEEGDEWYDVDTQTDEENNIWEQGMFYGMEKMFEIVKNSRIK